MLRSLALVAGLALASSVSAADLDGCRGRRGQLENEVVVVPVAQRGVQIDDVEGREAGLPPRLRHVEGVGEGDALLLRPPSDELDAPSPS